LNTERLRGILAAALVALFVALIAMFLALAGVISMPLAQIVLAFAFVVGAVFICLEALPKSSLRVKIVSVCGLAIALVVLDWWTLKQRRAHVYISRVQFVLGSKSPPDPENFANVIYKNEGEMDIHIRAYTKVEIKQTFWDDMDKEGESENQSFAKMLANLSKISPTDLEHDETEVPAHGEGYYSRSIPRTHELTTMSESIYFMGRITYTDENATHYTDFCKFISQKAEPVHSCKVHNEAP